MGEKRTVRLEELPDYLKDADDNRFVVSLLEDKCFSEDRNDVYARMANVRLTLFIEQTKKFFPGEHDNVKPLPASGEHSANWAS
jgi:hypothetical protein